MESRMDLEDEKLFQDQNPAKADPRITGPIQEDLMAEAVVTRVDCKIWQ